MRFDRKSFVVFALAMVVCGPAFGHAAEQGFVLLLPTTAYITGGTLAVAVTIGLLSVLRAGHLERVFAPLATNLTVGMVSARFVAQLAASLVLAGLIVIGLLGPTDPQANLLVLVLWTIWWMALFVVQGFVFDIWAWVNPWAGLHRLVLGDHDGWLHLPRQLSIWPAALIFLAFQGFVLADAAPNDPDRLALFALFYWLFTFAGMTLFGPAPWLRHVECFTVLFNLIGRIRMARGAGRLAFGCPGWQAVKGSPLGSSHAVFVLILLGAGSFDGLHETFWWLGQMGVNPLEFPGRSAMIYKTTFGLLGSIAVLIAVYALAIWVGVRAVAPIGPDFKTAFIGFSASLLPIAIGYHFAHYFVTFLVQIQVTLATLADPLARGWNLFGLGAVQVKVGFLAVPESVKTIWLIQAGVVVFSHILAVFLSHRTAESLCQGRGKVIRLQLGLSLLMVAYTIFGLWLLASPRGV